MWNTSQPLCSFGSLLSLSTLKFLGPEIAWRTVMSGEATQVQTLISRFGCRLGKTRLVIFKTQHTYTGVQSFQTIQLLYQKEPIQITSLILLITMLNLLKSLKTFQQEQLISNIIQLFSWSTRSTSSGLWIRFSCSLFYLTSWLQLSHNHMKK